MSGVWNPTTCDADTQFPRDSGFFKTKLCDATPTLEEVIHSFRNKGWSLLNDVHLFQGTLQLSTKEGANVPSEACLEALRAMECRRQKSGDNEALQSAEKARKHKERKRSATRLHDVSRANAKSSVLSSPTAEESKLARKIRMEILKNRRYPDKM